MTWESVGSRGGPNIERASVPGGWLVWAKESTSMRGMVPVGGGGDCASEVPVGFAGLTFYPDPNHTWDGR